LQVGKRLVSSLWHFHSLRFVGGGGETRSEGATAP
jgi:hypothetical protein